MSLAAPLNPPAPPPAALALDELETIYQQMDARLRRITGQVYAEVAEVKAGLAHLEGVQRQPAREMVREELQRGLEPARQAIAADWQQQVQQLEARMEALQNRVMAQLSELRGQMEAGLAAQSERLNLVTQTARAAAADEAHAVAERTVMSAASRISDQLAESILKALGRS